MGHIARERARIDGQGSHAKARAESGRNGFSGSAPADTFRLMPDTFRTVDGATPARLRLGSRRTSDLLGPGPLRHPSTPLADAIQQLGRPAPEAESGERASRHALPSGAHLESRARAVGRGCRDDGSVCSTSSPVSGVPACASVPTPAVARWFAVAAVRSMAGSAPAYRDATRPRRSCAPCSTARGGSANDAGSRRRWSCIT